MSGRALPAGKDAGCTAAKEGEVFGAAAARVATIWHTDERIAAEGVGVRVKELRGPARASDIFGHPGGGAVEGRRSHQRVSALGSTVLVDEREEFLLVGIEGSVTDVAVGECRNPGSRRDDANSDAQRDETDD